MLGLLGALTDDGSAMAFGRPTPGGSYVGLLQGSINVVAIFGLPGWLVLRGLLGVIGASKPETRDWVRLFALAGVLNGVWIFLPQMAFEAASDFGVDSQSLRAASLAGVAGLGAGITAWWVERHVDRSWSRIRLRGAEVPETGG